MREKSDVSWMLKLCWTRRKDIVAVHVESGSMTIKVTLNPGQKMNYRSHKNRDEVWVANLNSSAESKQTLRVLNYKSGMASELLC